MHVCACLTAILLGCSRNGSDEGCLKQSEGQLDTPQHLDKWGGMSLRRRRAPKHRLADCEEQGGTDLDAVVGRAT
jgi:hypothetical protein